MKNIEYDFDRETDKDFLREAGKSLQREVVMLRLEVFQLKNSKALDEEIKQKLTGELLVLRKKVFDSKQEKKEKLKKMKKDKKKKKINLLHNQNENKKNIEENPSIELESQEIEYSVEFDNCPDCDGDLVDLKGLFEESSEYDVNTTYYLLKRHKKKKSKCKSCNKIVTAKGPQKLKNGGQYSLQLAIDIVCDKFQHHIPLERQRKKMRNAGLNVSVKTLFSLTSHLYNHLIALEKLNKKDIFLGAYCCMDESPIIFYNPNKSKGYAWTVSNSKGAHYQFEPGRGGDVAKELIDGFEGVVITDGYGSYGFLGDKKNVIHAYCWAHLRRYFFDAMVENEKAGEVVDLVDSLYEIEHLASSYEELKTLRRTRSEKVYKNIVAWMDENEAHYLGSTLTGKAIKYFYNQQNGLEKFLSNEFAPLDNNMAERRQRCPVMGRKNYQAFRSVDGADIGMFFYSIIESCKTNGLNPSSYLLEMAIRSYNKKELDSPYQYAKKLKNEITEDLNHEISSLKA